MKMSEFYEFLYKQTLNGQLTPWQVLHKTVWNDLPGGFSLKMEPDEKDKELLHCWLTVPMPHAFTFEWYTVDKNADALYGQAIKTGTPTDLEDVFERVYDKMTAGR